tara:strand:+ start:506 stop:922 length:417 start_codon:yes stop_codon:yes gene_type:complete
MLKFLIIFINLVFVNSFFYLYLEKCNTNSDFSIDFLRYQYDDKHYPIYCNKKFEFNNIKYMYYNLKYDLIDCEKKKINYNDYLKNIWDLYGSCSNLDNYNYFNKTLTLFYRDNKLLNNYNCKHHKHCIIKYKDNFELL